MVNSSASVARRIDSPHRREDIFAVANQAHVSGVCAELEHRSAFATRAHARFLDVLGWNVAASGRREKEWHAPGQCCFVLRDGRCEEAAFGYTGLTLPHDINDPALCMAQRRVERFLAHLGEGCGVLVQNVPLLAFAGRRRDRIAVFGGWRFEHGDWKPFLLGPDGLGGLAAQEALFASGTEPCHIAGLCGHPVDSVIPRLADLVSALDRKVGGNEIATSRQDAAQLRIVPHAAGWSTALVERRAAAETPARQTDRGMPKLRLASSAAINFNWDPGSDEFRFHQYGADRG